ncbi:MAG: hypothetical protein ACLRZ9_10995 [Eubacterium sp.]
MKKKLIIVISILLIIGVGVTIGHIFNKNQKNNKITSESGKAESTGAIPEMSAYYGTEKVGEIDGYRMEMKEQYIRDTIIPISPERQVSISIETNKNKIQSISYELEGVKDNRLIDNGEITDWTEEEGKISCKYEASAIMNPGTEYILKFNITTDLHENIYYYTRAMVMDQEFVANQIKFAKDFSEKTFDGSKASELALFLEPDLKLANDNLGKITIKSSYTMLIWGELNPEKIGKTQITAKEFCIKDSGEAGTYTLNYQIQSANSEKKKETYNVAETITVWTCAGKQYVLAYDREVNQIWEADKNNVGNAFIDLGIQNITDVEHVESSNQQYIAYAINGDVYVMDVLEKKIQPVYQLNAKDSNQLYKTRAKVINVDDKGNVNYMIYGYSPADAHTGKSGISIMEYSNTSNESVEEAFIPCMVPAAVLEEQLSQLCYVGDGTLYIMLDNTIYYVNLKTKEWGTLASHLAGGACVISDDGTLVAYNTNGGEYDSESITIVNLTNGKKSFIEAGQGNVITVCGYTGTNLVYGLGESSEVKKYEFFPMNRLKIVDSNLNEVKSYEKKGVYITDVEITDTIINIKRWKKGKAIDDDQLLDNTETNKLVANSSYYNDDLKKRELALAFTNNLDAAAELAVGEPGKVSFSGNVEVNSKFEESTDTKYYVYGYGKLQGIYTDRNQAIKAAREAYGLVADEKGQKIWIFEENYN